MPSSRTRVVPPPCWRQAINSRWAASAEDALGVIESATDAGLAVPHDLSVVGFDDVPEAARARPPLTTVGQDHVHKGRLAGRLLIAGLRGEPTKSPEPVASRLVVRGSTAPPPAE